MTLRRSRSRCAAWPLDDVAELVAHCRGELRLVVHQGQQAAGHEDIAARDGMGVGGRLVEHIETVAARQGGATDQPLADPADHRLQFGRVVERADQLLDVLGQGVALGRWHGGRRGLDARCAAAGQEEQRQERKKAAKNH
jgi:hypothetical protein